MKKMKWLFYAYLLLDVFVGGYCGGLFPLTPAAAAQTILTNTTLSAAVSDGFAKTVVVASATGINAPSSSDYTKPTYLFVDRELMEVQAVNSTTITVTRGVSSTFAAAHASGALVFVVPEYLSYNMAAIPQGSCTRSSEPVLPRISFVAGIVSDCLGGQWIQGDALQTQRITINGSTSGANGFRYPDPGGTALTSLETSGTAAAANTEIYCTEIDLPYSMLISGLAPLNGTTVGTNKHFAILYDATGNVLANSAIAGVTTAGASTYQKLAFVTKYYAVGPARYFGCDGLNGTTDTIRHAITAVNDNVLGGTVTAQVFGTAAAITAPSSFTTAKVPYFMVF